MAVIHPLFRLIASRPQMIADHVEAYSDLLAEEVGQTTTALKKRVTLGAIGLANGAVAIVLAGVALMLWAVTPVDRMNAPWALIAVPGVPAILCIWCVFAMRAASIENSFKNLRAQFAADAAMLREVSESV
jgi:uncharacterized membrane protein YqjE